MKELHNAEIHKNEALDITGWHGAYCVFENCKLTRRAPITRTRLYFAHYVNCELLGRGWPKWMRNAAEREWASDKPKGETANENHD